MIDTGLRDEVALATGANHGIGAATAKALAEQGAGVFIMTTSVSSRSNTIACGAATDALVNF